MSPEPDLDWIRSQLETLYTHGEEIASIAESTNKLRPWSALKLITLAYSIDVYTTVISNRFDDWYYIDALAGSGALSSENFDTKYVGSPIIAASVAAEPFTQMYFIERKTERAEALKQRLDYVADEIDDIDLNRDSYTVLEGDTNDQIPEIPNKIRDERAQGLRGAHHFAFVDNERADVTWNALNQLSNMWGDWLINYQPTGINRERGKDKIDRLNHFYGTDSHLELNNDNQRLDLYLKQLDAMGREEQRTIRVNGSKEHPYYYHLIYATRETQGGNKWLEAVESIKSNVEMFDGDDITRILDVLRGDSVLDDSSRQSGLGDF